MSKILDLLDDALGRFVEGVIDAVAKAWDWLTERMWAALPSARAYLWLTMALCLGIIGLAGLTLLGVGQRELSAWAIIASWIAITVLGLMVLARGIFDE